MAFSTHKVQNFVGHLVAGSSDSIRFILANLILTVQNYTLQAIIPYLSYNIIHS